MGDNGFYERNGEEIGFVISVMSGEQDRLDLTLARQYEDKETRAKYYDLFQEELAKDPAYAFICYIDANYVADSDIKGISEKTVLGHHGVGIFWNIQDWEIVK